ncbi:hypothetical protein [Paenibacillus cisolokensis]|nr:hypothetical protein [Paenibacillus cisolokensis]
MNQVKSAEQAAQSEATPSAPLIVRNEQSAEKKCWISLSSTIP